MKWLNETGLKSVIQKLAEMVQIFLAFVVAISLWVKK